MLNKLYTHAALAQNMAKTHWFSYQEDMEDTIISNLSHKSLLAEYENLMSRISELEDSIRTEWVFKNIKSVMVKPENGNTENLFGESSLSFEENRMVILPFERSSGLFFIKKDDVTVFENGTIKFTYAGENHFFFIPDWKKRMSKLLTCAF